jgi:hypothetical protein
VTTAQLATFDAPQASLSRAEAGVRRELRPGPERLLAALVCLGLEREALPAAAALVRELDAKGAGP